MSNQYFSFKKFTINQSNCAMKVGTDGVLLGAWIEVADKHRILDVGTGTGLIAIMAAQRTVAFIDAVEIDEAAYNQAKENVLSSPRPRQINIFNQSYGEYSAECQFQYDLIVSNPPYFRNSLQSYCSKRSAARHTEFLSYSDLFCYSNPLLTANGCIVIIFPFDLQGHVDDCAAASGFYPVKKLQVKGRENNPPKRLIVEYSRTQGECSIQYLTIEVDRHVYTPDYICLTRDYYLNL